MNTTKSKDVVAGLVKEGACWKLIYGDNHPNLKKIGYSVKNAMRDPQVAEAIKNLKSDDLMDVRTDWMKLMDK